MFVNGVSAGIQIVPEYRFRIGKLLKQGVNRIAIEQATTLERVVSRVNSVSREPIVPTNHLGIDGTVELSGTGADIGRIIRRFRAIVDLAIPPPCLIDTV